MSKPVGLVKNPGGLPQSHPELQSMRSVSSIVEQVHFLFFFFFLPPPPAC